MLSRFRRSRRDERGLSLAVMSLLLVGLLAMAGLVVDLGTWQVEASNIQQAADAASLAGVVRLPDGDVAAEERARSVAGDNGYVDGVDGVTVSVVPQGDESLAVTITKTDVPQYFSRVVRAGQSTTISRTSTAQYVQPVPLGSPRNYLGTGNLLLGNPNVSGDGVENFWLSVSGGCTRREYGDRIATIAMAIPNYTDGDPYACQPPSIAEQKRLENPEHEPRGYLFGVTVPEASGNAPVDIQMFDAPTCTSGTNKSRAGDEQKEPFDVTVTVRSDALDPYTGTPVATKTFVGSSDTSGDCGVGPVGGECAPGNALRSCWTTLATVNAPGNYYVQVNPVFAAVDSRHDNFSLRAKRNGTFTPCTGDSTVPAGSLPAYDPTCANVYGTEHLPVFANVGSSSPVFFLSSIDSRHNGKKMQVTLYDAAEGASAIELLNPIGGKATFDWTVLCADGTEPSGNNCPGEIPPFGGRSGTGVNVLPTADSVCPASKCPRTFGDNNTQHGKYSDRLVRLTVQLPSNMETAYRDPVTGQQRTWWKIEYSGNFGGDRTTWSVKLIGDPVRLVPNAPPTTAPAP